MSSIVLTKTTTPSTPMSNKVGIFVDSTGVFSKIDDTGTVTQLGSTGPGVPTGGTTGQVLIKDSETNYDTSWADPPTPTNSVRFSTHTVTPATTDDNIAGYRVGDIWIDSVGESAYICISSTTSNALWKLITPAV